MKCVILAGGMQSTLTRAGELLPKPMIDVGGKPLLWHIMKHFSEYGISEFIICGGYKIDVIKEYFIDFYIYESDITVDLSNNNVKIHNNKTENWTVTVVDTGLESAILERIKRVEGLVNEDFIVTYGDCLSDIDIKEMYRLHSESGASCTLALTKPVGRRQFIQLGEKGENHIKENNNAWISSDCFILNSDLLSLIKDSYKEESQLFSELDKEQKLCVYKHYGYWTAIETMRDLVDAEKLWEKGIAPWIKGI